MARNNFLDAVEKEYKMLIAASYYLDRMPIRKDNREGQPGVELLLEIQFINVANCKPVAGAYVDAWHANGEYNTIE